MLDKEHIMKIPFTEKIGGHEFDMVALYNSNRITEQGAIDLLNEVGSCDDIVIMTKVQFENIFLTKEEGE